ncbi:glyoxalase superfamily protein [Methylobacterium sp. WL8]|uniref:glyoxalase superfamily protein n=1 Tax=Methylobacterium sp. WL8 TaxID=2603899 RepID=UPI0011C7F5A3|nr:glyoxalase superfamily protein [Methylobacterium sp. WL8]TXN79742.1 VOC family protein [Methylobacterium sp. WL8]
MTTVDQAKAMAKRLRAALSARDLAVSHATTLELVAASLGHDDWNTASAALDRPAENVPRFLEAVPILRIFDEAKAREFYCGFLGFETGFEHRFEPSLPLYMEVARAGLRLHLSEHHGDASPGSTVFVPMRGVHAYHRQLTDKRYGYARPGIEQAPWGDVLEVADPFGNRLRFCERRVG